MTDKLPCVLTKTDKMLRCIKRKGDEFDYLGWVENEKPLYPCFRKLIVKCKKNQHVFSQSYTRHIKSNGCFLCNKIGATEKLVRCTLKYGNSFRRSWFDCNKTTSNDYLLVICPNEHVYKQRYDHHYYDNHGCKQCYLNCLQSL